MNTGILATAVSALLLFSLGALDGGRTAESPEWTQGRPLNSVAPVFHVRRMPWARWDSDCDGRSNDGVQPPHDCVPLYPACAGAPRTEGSVLITWIWNVFTVICVEFGSDRAR